MNNSLKGKDILSLSQFDRSSVEHVLHTAKRLSDELAEKRQLDYLKGYMASIIFFEPSTRTFSSFATAVKKMGGQTLEHQNPEHTHQLIV